MQYHAIPCNSMQYNAILCNTMQHHAVPCNSMQYHAIPCDTMQYHAIPCNAMQYHAIPCNTIHHLSLLTERTTALWAVHGHFYFFAYTSLGVSASCSRNISWTDLRCLPQGCFRGMWIVRECCRIDLTKKSLIWPDNGHLVHHCRKTSAL